MHKIYTIFVFAFSTLFLAPHAYANDTKDFGSFEDIFAWADSPEIADFIDTTPIAVTRAATKESVLGFLFDFKVPELLQENFFLRSNNIISRSLLDYPEFLPFRHDKDKNAVYVDLFFNQTDRGFFTRSSSNICSYLAVTSPALQQKIENTLESVRLAIPDIPQSSDLLNILDLFATFTVQERRFGLMVGGKGVLDKWHINAMAPLYYLERNHFVNQRTQDDLREITDELFGPQNDPKKEKEFQDRFFISDKFGIGDTRIYADYPLAKGKYINMRLGFLTTLPTAFAFEKGLRGTHFRRSIVRPELDLVQVFSLVDEKRFDEANALTSAYLFETIDNLNAILLDTPLGNNGHVGLGIYLKNKMPISKYIKQSWSHRLIWRSFMSLEYLIPATEQRSYVLPAIIKDFTARDFDPRDYPDDQAQINSNYDFLVQQITDRLFPVTYNTRVAPGFIFRSSSQLCYEGDYSGFTVGTDTYVRTKESLKNIERCLYKDQLIDICNARAPFAYQSKAVASVFFKVHQPDKLWTLSLIGDYTFMNRGIGNDFLLGFNVDVIF